MIMKKQMRILVLLIVVAFTFSCDLPLQDTYSFHPDVDLTDPFAGGTAWDFLNSEAALKKTPTGALYGDSFDYLVAAIKKAGLVDLYSQTETSSRTYLLLNNDAFTGTGDVIHIVTGSATVPAGQTPDQVMDRVDTPAKMQKLKNVLNYHIVTTKIVQVPTLAVIGTEYIFQTLIPGVDGLIGLKRTDRYAISINTAASSLPSSATTEPENVRNHNYVFNNGIGHIIADPVRNKPY